MGALSLVKDWMCYLDIYLFFLVLDDFLLESKSFLFSFDVKRSYIVYPPEGPRPPSPEELREMARELARKKNNH